MRWTVIVVLAACRAPAPAPPVGHAAAPSPAASVEKPPAPTPATPDDAIAAANRAYDRGEFDEAAEDAVRILRTDPQNVRMLRLITSVACIQGNVDEAREYYARLPARDQAQMVTRCARYGIALP